MSATTQYTPAPSAPAEPNPATLLRAIATWLESHPDAHVSQIDSSISASSIVVRDYTVHGADQLAEQARAIGGKWTKKLDGQDDSLFKLVQEIAPGVTYELVAWRDEVCTRVVTGTKTTTVTEPDPELVAALPVVEREVTTETVE